MLVEMGVEMLVLPGIAQLSDTWVSAFGFSEMPAALRTEFSAYPFVVFQGTTMFHKALSRAGNFSYMKAIGQYFCLVCSNRAGVSLSQETYSDVSLQSSISCMVFAHVNLRKIYIGEVLLSLVIMSYF